GRGGRGYFGSRRTGAHHRSRADQAGRNGIRPAAPADSWHLGKNAQRGAPRSDGGRVRTPGGGERSPLPEQGCRIAPALAALNAWGEAFARGYGLTIVKPPRLEHRGPGQWPG